MKVILTFDTDLDEPMEALREVVETLDDMDFDPYLACYEIKHDDGTSVFVDGNGDPR